MSFTTGRAQRRGQQSATVGTSFSHLKQTSFPIQDLLRQPQGPFRSTTKKRKTVSIGDDTATGLIIHGSHTIDTFEGTNPDATTPPLSGSTLADPDFPVSYNGRGTLKFISPIRITTIDGPLNVNGEVYSSSGLLGPAGGGGGVDSADWSIEVGGTGAGINFTKDAGNTWATYHVSNDNVTLHVHYTWTSKNSLADGTAIYIKNLPYVIEFQTHKTVIQATSVTPTQLGSYFVIRGDNNSDELVVLSADSGTGTEVAVTGAQCGTSGTISFILSYHAVIP